MPRSRILQATFAVLALAAFGAPTFAQQAHAPYAGLETREIKALSNEQIADLAAGRGMGLALAAELNGYPGPLHVLELADRLALTDAQRAEVKRQFEAMRAETIPLGKALIAAERELDRAFAGRTVTPERLRAATARIAELQGALRNAHLMYHLSTSAALSAEQTHRYAELRGYVGAAQAAPSQHGAADHGAHRHIPGARH